MQLSARHFIDQLRSPYGAEDLSVANGTPLVMVDLSAEVDPLDVDRVAPAIEQLVCVVVGVGTPSSMGAQRLAELCDLCLGTDDDPASIIEPVSRHPIASASLVMLLRGGDRRTITEGLVAESAVYSLLQSGPEFASWRASRARRAPRPEPSEAVRVERRHNRLHVVLSRPHVHNAFNVALRDQLVEALRIALVDPSIEQVLLTGDGPSFCSGGDLDEFGSFTDPASAHVVRLTRSAGAIVSGLGPRIESYLHGACMGAGIEVPTFGGLVAAHPDSRIALPELSLGLIPGAGGTVSLPRRIGKQRTALLALSGMVIDAPTALGWGLIDEIRDEELPSCL